MGGVDKSDQYIQYHRILHQTKKYWKTLFYHTIEIAVTNAFLLYLWQQMIDQKNRVTENSFRDNLVTQLSNWLEYHDATNPTTDSSSSSDESGSMDISTPFVRILHGSRFFASQNRCVICGLKTTRRYPDCPRKPPLCQTPNRDCHPSWHAKRGLQFRRKWLQHKRILHDHKGKGGRPKGSTRKGCK